MDTRGLCGVGGAALASTPFVVGGVVKIGLELTLWCLFRRVKPLRKKPLSRDPCRRFVLTWPSASPLGSAP